MTDEHLEIACRNLEKIDFILFAETLDQDVDDLHRAFHRRPPNGVGRRNETDKNFLTQPETYRRAEDLTFPEDDHEFFEGMQALTRFDARLYEFARELRKKRGFAPAAPAPLDFRAFELIEGEVLRAESPAFAKALGVGWQADPSQFIWSVEDDAHVFFAIKWKSPCETAVLRAQLAPCMIPGRGRLDLRILCNGRQVRHAVFIEDGFALNRSRIPETADVVCAGDKTFSLDIPLGEAVAGEEYHVVFRLGARSAPINLAYNPDERELGVRLLSLMALNAEDAAN